jgi:hypothetical protein
VKCLVDNPGDKESKLLLLEESLEPNTFLAALDAPLSTHLSENSIEVTTHTFNLTYESLSAEDVLRVRYPVTLVPMVVNCTLASAWFNHEHPET